MANLLGTDKPANVADAAIAYYQANKSWDFKLVGDLGKIVEGLKDGDSGAQAELIGKLLIAVRCDQLQFSSFSEYIVQAGLVEVTTRESEFEALVAEDVRELGLWKDLVKDALLNFTGSTMTATSIPAALNNAVAADKDVYRINHLIAAMNIAEAELGSVISRHNVYHDNATILRKVADSANSDSALSQALKLQAAAEFDKYNPFIKRAISSKIPAPAVKVSPPPAHRSVAEVFGDNSPPDSWWESARLALGDAVIHVAPVAERLLRKPLVRWGAGAASLLATAAIVFSPFLRSKPELVEPAKEHETAAVVVAAKEIPKPLAKPAPEIIDVKTAPAPAPGPAPQVQTIVPVVVAAAPIEVVIKKPDEVAPAPKPGAVQAVEEPSLFPTAKGVLMDAIREYNQLPEGMSDAKFKEAKNILAAAKLEARQNGLTDADIADAEKTVELEGYKRGLLATFQDIEDKVKDPKSKFVTTGGVNIWVADALDMMELLEGQGLDLKDPDIVEGFTKMNEVVKAQEEKKLSLMIKQ